jgi:hypothetical protein
MSSSRMCIITACWHELHMNLSSESSQISFHPSFLFPALPTLRQGGGDMETDPTQPLSRKPIKIQPDGSNMRKAGHQLYRCRARHQNLQPNVPPIWWKKNRLRRWLR